MLASILKMASSSKAHYLIIALSISISKVASYSDYYLSFPFVEDNVSERGGGSEHNSDSVTDVGKKDTHQDDEIDYSENRTLEIINHEIEYSGLKTTCPHYKHGKTVEFDTICDVWQLVYYKLAEDLLCFKIYIRKVSEEEKAENALKYGTFSNKVKWNACDLEVVQGGQTSESMRRHFLQRVAQGVMINVIIMEHTVPWKLHTSRNQSEIQVSEKANSTYTLNPESPDQWLVVNNLLLLRDCFDGDVIVFARAPHQPRRREISEALAIFGEFDMEGKMACR